MKPTQLLKAVQTGNLAKVQAGLEQQLDPNHSDPNGYSLGIVKLLVERDVTEALRRYESC